MKLIILFRAGALTSVSSLHVRYAKGICISSGQYTAFIIYSRPLNQKFCSLLSLSLSLFLSLSLSLIISPYRSYILKHFFFWVFVRVGARVCISYFNSCRHYKVSCSKSPTLHVNKNSKLTISSMNFSTHRIFFKSWYSINC